MAVDFNEHDSINGTAHALGAVFFLQIQQACLGASAQNTPNKLGAETEGSLAVGRLAASSGFSYI